MKRNAKIISFLSVITGTLFSSIVLSLAWFEAQDVPLEFDDGMGGSVLTNYFHTGDGSQEHPFVITRPKHYENLVKLHHLVPEFASNSYYYELGYDLDNDGAKEFYNYTDSGTKGDGYSVELNLAGLSTLEPIGNKDYPFTSHFNGNGLTVKNFKVSPDATKSTKYNDVGIFGFVKEEASITNTYWANFSIDPSGADSSTVHGDEALYPHTQDSNVGYLAGHVINSDSFTECYVNSCTIEQSKGTSDLHDGYGYYGLVEKYSDDGGLGYGSNYEFHFDAQATHTFFENNWDSIKGLQATARNTEYSPNPTTLTNTTISNAMMQSDTKIGSWQILTGYFFDGKSTQYPSKTTTYSLSTLGYLAGQKTTQVHDDEVQYKNTKTNSYYSMPSNAKLSDKNYDENEETGHFYNYDDREGKWEYYYTEPKKTTSSDTCGVTFKFKKQSESEGDKITKAKITVYIYIDNVLKHSGTNTLTPDGNKVTFTYPNVTINGLSIGSHYYAVKVYKDIDYKSSLGWATYNADYWYCVTSDTRSYVASTRGYRYNTSTLVGEGETDKILYNKSNGKYYIDDVTVDFKKISGNSNDAHNIEPELRWDKSSVAFGAGTILHTSASFNYDLYALDSFNGFTPTILQSDDSISFRSLNIVYDSDTKKWMTHYTITHIDTSSSTNYYWVSESDELVESGYVPENIDVVGGTAGFYYQNIIKGLRLNSEGKSSSYQVIKSITASDVGKHFYATERCNQSIVLYIKNMGNASDDKDENIGSINMRYSMYSVLGMESVQPSFKKGNGTYYDMEKIYSGIETTSVGTSEYQFEIELTESIVQKYAYCCLDKDGNILGNFGISGGNPTDGVGFSTDPSTKSKIATYVLVIGGFTNADTAVGSRYLFTRNIDFKFTADGGVAGSFGSVGYRSRGDTVTSTIINFTFDVDTSYTFSVLINYVSSEKKYYVTFSANKAVDVTFFNYYPDTFSLNINGTDAGGSKYIYNYSP